MTDKIHPTILKELIDLGDRLTEDRLREIVIAEIESNEMDGVAQAYALEEADGDEKKARAYYTKHRVRRIRDLIAQETIRIEQKRVEAEKEAKQQKEKQRIIEQSKKAADAKLARQETVDKVGKATGTVLDVFTAFFVVVVVIAILIAIFRGF